MAIRTALRLFLLANDAYANAKITAYQVDASGNRLGTLATLYDTPTGGDSAPNPFNLDGDGKLGDPLYHTEALICSIEGIEVPAHDTGVIGVENLWRGSYLSGTIYYAGNVIQDGPTKRVYVATTDFTATTLNADINAGRLDLMIDTAAVSTQTITRHTATGDGTTTAFVMPVTPANTASVIVSVAGADSTAWTLSTNTITFGAAPANGAALVFHIITTIGSQLSGGGSTNGFGNIWCGTAGGTPDAVTLAPSPAVTALVAGMRLSFKTGILPNTGAPATITVSALSGVNWLRADGSALALGDAPANTVVSVIYDGAALRMDSLDPTTVVAASETDAGILKLSTLVQAEAGVDDLTALTPLKLRSIRRAQSVISTAASIVATDHGSTKRFDNTFTQPLPAAASLGNGFSFRAVNVGTGVITFDPSGSELIDGSLTFALPPRFSAELFCTGTEWLVLGCPTEILIGTQTVAGSAVGAVDFLLPSPALAYRFAFQAKPSASASLQLRTSVNAGVSFESGGSDYVWSTALDPGTGSNASATRTGASSIQISQAAHATGPAFVTGNGNLKVGSGSLFPTVDGVGGGTIEPSGGAFVTYQFSGRREAAAAINAIRFLFSGGANIAILSTFSLYGIRK